MISISQFALTNWTNQQLYCGARSGCALPLQPQQQAHDHSKKISIHWPSNDNTISALKLYVQWRRTKTAYGRMAVQNTRKVTRNFLNDERSIINKPPLDVRTNNLGHDAMHSHVQWLSAFIVLSFFPAMCNSSCSMATRLSVGLVCEEYCSTACIIIFDPPHPRSHPPALLFSSKRLLA